MVSQNFLHDSVTNLRDRNKHLDHPGQNVSNLCIIGDIKTDVFAITDITEFDVWICPLAGHSNCRPNCNTGNYLFSSTVPTESNLPVSSAVAETSPLFDENGEEAFHVDLNLAFRKN